jgi:hypothetical protein
VDGYCRTFLLSCKLKSGFWTSTLAETLNRFNLWKSLAAPSLQCIYKFVFCAGDAAVEPASVRLFGVAAEIADAARDGGDYEMVDNGGKSS